jgi:hypothetical protein
MMLVSHVFYALPRPDRRDLAMRYNVMTNDVDGDRVVNCAPTFTDILRKGAFS